MAIVTRQPGVISSGYRRRAKEAVLIPVPSEIRVAGSIQSNHAVTVQFLTHVGICVVCVVSSLVFYTYCNHKVLIERNREKWLNKHNVSLIHETRNKTALLDRLKDEARSPQFALLHGFQQSTAVAYDLTNSNSKANTLNLATYETSNSHNSGDDNGNDN